MPRALVVMDDTLLAEALAGHLGQFSSFQVAVVTSGSLDMIKEAEFFAPQIVLTDRHPSSAMLRVAACLRMKIAVVTPREQPVTLYEVSQQEVSSVQGVVALLGTVVR